MGRRKGKGAIATYDFALLFLCRFAYSAFFLMLTAVVAPFAVSCYGSTDAEAGVAVGVFIIAALASRLLVENMVAHFGYMGVLRVSAIGFFGASVLYLLPFPYAAFLFVRLVNGLFFGFLSNVVSSVAVFVIPKDRIGEGFGYLSLSTNLASAFGPLLGLSLCERGLFQVVFLAAVLLAIAALVPVLLLTVRAKS